MLGKSKMLGVNSF